MSLIWGGMERRKTDRVGSAEEARRDTALYQQAARELGEGALPSAIACRAQKLKNLIDSADSASQSHSAC
jgi:hypothetical protein